MRDLTDKGLLIYCTLRDIMEADVDFIRAIVTCIDSDLARCNMAETQPRLFVDEWIDESNYYFSTDEKEILSQLLNQFGFLPMQDAIFRLYDEMSAEMLLFDLGIPLVNVDEWDFKNKQ